ncbi:MAG TPA: hypothetical protein ENL03_06100, partial [Phycisphaerae bacterium]|nr:hypothetical protein [Phycisphaerae bacterium]
MKIRTFEAKTAFGALARARNDFGPGVIILDSRPIRRGGLLGFVGVGKGWQVIASESGSGDDVDSQAQLGQYVAADLPAASSKKTIRAIAALEAVDRERQEQETSSDVAGELAEIRQSLTKLLSQKQQSSAENSFPAIENARRNLLDRGVDGEVVNNLLSDIARDLSWTQLQDDEALSERLTQSLAKSIHTVNGNPPPQRPVP